MKRAAGGGGTTDGGKGENGPARVLNASGVGKSFGKESVLRDASLRGTEGCVTALLGRSGAGKTTLLRIAAGLLRPDRGTVVFRGRRHDRARLPALAREGLLYLPDRGGLFARSRPLRWYLASAARRWGEGNEADWRDLARTRGVERVVDRDVRELTCGERRRAETVVATLREPACLLADDLYCAIAPSDAETVTRALIDLRDRGCAIVVAGREAPGILEAADRVVWLTDGTTHDLGTPEDARGHPEFVRDCLTGSRRGRRQRG